MTERHLQADAPHVLPRRIGFWGASAVMIGIIIGSGIFRTPASIANESGDPLVILLLWLAGGLLSLCGAFAYAELATMFPQSGGVYVYLREAFGPCMAFVFGWTYMLISKPAAAAGIAVIFAEHMNHLLGTQIDKRVIVCVMIVALTALNTVGIRSGSGTAIALTLAKVAALTAIVVLGFSLRGAEVAHLESAPMDKSFIDALPALLYAVLWTYDGWSDVGAIAGEVQHPQRTLPRVFVTGTVVMIGLYVAVNAVYMSVMPLTEMRTLDIDNHDTVTIAPTVFERLIGPVGAQLATIIVVLSTFGSTHGSILTGARVTFAQARDGLLFRFLGRVSPRFETPAISLWVQAALSCAAVIMLKEFKALTGAFMFTMWIFYGLAGLAVIILRFKLKDWPRSYRCLGYPVVPLLFVLSATLMTVLEIRSAPLKSLIWVGILLCGIPIYYGWRRLYPAKPGEPASAHPKV